MNKDAFSVVGDAGASVGGYFGRVSFEALHCGFVAGLMAPKFSNLPTLRTRTHTTIYGPRGIQKSTFIDVFCDTIPSRLKVVQLSYATVEILCGSITSPRNPFQLPRLIPSVLADADFVKILEEWSILGHGGSTEMKISILNDALEGARISTSLVKLGQVVLDPAQIQELERLKISYDPNGATASFVPRFTANSASHLYDRKTLGLLNDFGFRDRFRIVQLQVTPEIARERFQQEYIPDEAALAELKRINSELSQVKIKAIETLPNELLKPIYEKLFPLMPCPDFRLKGDILRAASSHMVMRHYSEGKLKEVYTQQDYTLDDSQYVIDRLPSFVEPRVRPLIAEGYVEIGRTRVRDNARGHIVAFLKDSEMQGRDGESLASIHSYVLGLMPMIHYQTVNNALGELVREGLVEHVPDKHGFYRLVKKEEESM